MKFADKLSNVTQTAPDSWSADCPVCGHKGLPLTIVRNHKGAVDLWCMVGCDKEAVLEAAGIMWADLYPPEEPMARMTPVRPGAAIDMDVERWVVKIGDAALEDGQQLSLYDLARLQVARQRLAGE